MKIKLNRVSIFPVNSQDYGEACWIIPEELVSNEWIHAFGETFETPQGQRGHAVPNLENFMIFKRDNIYKIDVYESTHEVDSDELPKFD